MRFEPPIDRSTLLRAVRDAYGLPVNDLTFIPASSWAACYALHAGGERYFLKLWLRLRLSEPAAERQHASLVLTRALHDRGCGLRLPYPLLTRSGDLWIDLAGAPFAVAPLLTGGKAPSPWPVALSAELGRTVAAVHRATAGVSDLRLPREPLTVWFESALQRDLAAAERIGAGSRPGQRAGRRWVLGRRRDIAAQLERLRRLQAAAERLEEPFVLCHTDLHTNNWLVDEQGQIAVLDWDDAKLAPREHDLWSGLGPSYGGADFTAFLVAYQGAAGAPPLHRDQFAFYLLRRFVEDMAVYLHDLLDPAADEREDAALLHGMESSAAFWSRIDDTLAVVDAAFHGSHG